MSEQTNLMLSYPGYEATSQTFDTDTLPGNIGRMFSKLVDRLLKWQGINFPKESLERIAEGVEEQGRFFQSPGSSKEIPEWNEFVGLVTELAGSRFANGRVLHSTSIEPSGIGKEENQPSTRGATIKLGSGSTIRVKQEGLELSLTGGDELLRANLVLMLKP